MGHHSLEDSPRCAHLRKADGSYYPEPLIDVSLGTNTLTMLDDGGERTFAHSAERVGNVVTFIEVPSIRRPG